MIFQKDELVSLLINESFHSFEINDEFPAVYIADLAMSVLQARGVEITMEGLLKRVQGFINHKRKKGLIESTSQKWEVTINGKEVKRKVYKKTGELSTWKTEAKHPIPDEYYDFIEEWNDSLVSGEIITARQFHDHLEELEIPITYEGQVGKFLWMLADRGFCACTSEGKCPNTSIYKKTRDVPDSELEEEGVRFYKKRVGPYQSKLHLID